MADRTSPRTLSYRPGGWLGIVGAGATVLLPGSEKARAGALWALIDDGAGFDAVLDALVAGGLSSLPGFVLLSPADDTVRVLVRGEAMASFETGDGPVVVAAEPGSMWSERTVAATDFAVTLPDEPGDGPSLAVAEGLVRLGSLETSSAAASLAPVVKLAAVGPVAEPAEPAELPATDLDFLADEPVFPRPVTALDALEEPDDLGGDDDFGDAATEVHDAFSEESDDLQDLEDLEDLQDDADGPEDDEAPTDEQPALGAPPAWTPDLPAPPAPSIPPPPVPPAPLGADEVTEALVPPLGGPPPVPPAPLGADEVTEALVPPPAAPAPVPHLSFSSGAEVDVDGLVVVGRRPDAGRFPPEDRPLLVPVPSPHSEISSTHLEVRSGSGAAAGKVVVTDLGSTNGTLVVPPGHKPEELRPGVPAVLDSGALIDLGDGLTIRVR